MGDEGSGIIHLQVLRILNLLHLGITFQFRYFISKRDISMTTGWTVVITEKAPEIICPETPG